MLDIKLIDKECTEQCTSCHCTNDRKEIYIIHIGFSARQTVGIKLCKDCLNTLKQSIQKI